MTITAEQADQARGIILDCLNVHHQNRIPFKQVWTKPDEDFEGNPFLIVWAIYGGDPRGLDVRLLNSFDAYLIEHLLKAGIRAMPSVSYVHESETDQLSTQWTGQS